MKLINTIEALEQHLEKLITDSRNDKKDSEEQMIGYRQGVMDALKLLRLFKEQQKPVQTDPAASLSGKPENKKRLFELSPETISRMDLNDPDIRIARTDLVEAAFHFENLLLDTLGDPNTIPYENYDGLSADQLCSIIQHCTEKIARLKK